MIRTSNGVADCKLDLAPVKALDPELLNTQSILQWHSHAFTHAGRVRHINEDAFYASDEKGLWAVADGMGGHSRGDYASKAIKEALKSFTPQSSVSESLADLEEQLFAVNHRCRNAFRGKRVGSTLALMHQFANHVFFIWAGDSRIYRLRQNEFVQLTVDHSLAQEKLERGQISAEEAHSHPSAHVLTRAIGIYANLKLQLSFQLAQPGDRYLICTDGLYNDLRPQELQSMLADTPISASTKGLLEKALDRGGRDNISAVVIDAIECAPD